MKKGIIIILVLAMVCTVLCGCDWLQGDRDGGNVSDNKNGVITDGGKDPMPETSTEPNNTVPDSAVSPDPTQPITP